MGDDLLPPSPSDDESEYVGLPVDVASERALQRGWTKVRTASPGQPVTADWAATRINFVVVDDVVTDCWLH